MQLLISILSPSAEVQWQLTCTRVDEWLHTEVFHLRWWFLLSLFIICAYTWWKLVDKSRLNEIIIYTSLIILIILTLDELGQELGLWDYPVDVVPLFPPISAIDFSCMPIVYSLIFQHFRTWKSFIISTLLMSFIFCFLLEPIFVWLGIYQMLNWKSYFGFPIYAAMAIICKLAVTKIYSISSKAGN